MKMKWSNELNIVFLFMLFGSAKAVSHETDLSKYSFKDYTDHECLRECSANALPKTCEYHFIVENYHSMSKACFNCPFNQSDCLRPHCISAGGTDRTVVTVNRMLPGPAIQVCDGDTVIVKVYNEMLAEGTTIHWHGIHQTSTPYFDGVPMVTQCPIPVRTSFTYRFKADPPGTHYWHSHSGVQRADGMFGPLIVRQAQDKDPNWDTYDHDLPEHIILFHDWFIEPSMNRHTGHHHTNYDNKPKTALINGLGSYQGYTEEGNDANYFTPNKVYMVEPNLRYRFRLISNALMNCPLLFSIDSHNLTVVASDGKPFEPYQVDSLMIFAGERYDIVVHANAETISNYWIRLYGMADCTPRKVHQEAILHYTGAAEANPKEDTSYEAANRIGKQLNPLNTKATETMVSIEKMTNSLPNDKTDNETWAKPEADVKFYLSFDFMKVDNFWFNYPTYYPLYSTNKNTYSPQVNHISLSSPPSPLLTQSNDVPQEMFCNEDTVSQSCNETFCTCLHTLKVPLGKVAEFILVDEGKVYNANHPFHMHGYSFRVVGMDRLKAGGITKAEIMALDSEGKLERKLDRAILKDSITVPDGGYTIMRIHATNPGFWLFHCHLNFHSEIGMGVIIQVGEVSDMIKAPQGFPKCGDWDVMSHNEEPEEDNKEMVMECSSGAASIYISMSTIILIIGLLHTE